MIVHADGTVAGCTEDDEPTACRARDDGLFPDDLDALAERIDETARVSADERAGFARGSAVAEVIELQAKEA